MRQLFKKIMVCFLAIQLAFFSPIAQAAGWNFGGYNFGNGSLNITKNGVKITTAAVDSAPITSNLGAKILGGAIRGANVLTAISIIAGISESAIDWVLDPANNAIKYKDTGASAICASNLMLNNMTYSQAVDSIKKQIETRSPQNFAMNFEGVISVTCAEGMVTIKVKRSWCQSGCAPGVVYTYGGSASNGDYVFNVTGNNDNSNTYKSISIPTVAQKIFDMAKSGNANAQADVTSAVNELVNTGTYDTPISQAIQQAIDNGTLPKDTDTNNPTNPQIDTSSIIAAIQSLASSLSSSISNSYNAIASVINTSIDKLLNKQEQMQGELVNVGSKVDSVGGQVVGVGDKVDNVGGKVVGVGDAVKDVGGKVVGLNDSVDKVGDKVVGVGDKVTATGDKVTDAVTGVGDKVGTKVDAVGDKVTAVGDKVGEKVDASTAANERIAQKVDDLTKKVDTVGEKVEAAGDKVTDAIKEKKQEENQETQCPPMTIKVGEKCISIPLPDLDEKMTCSYSDFTQKVCDFTDWAKSPFEQPDEDGQVNIEVNSDLPSITTDKVKFDNQCPAPTPLDVSIPSLMINFHDELNYQPICDFMTKLRPFVVGFGYVSGAFIVAGVGRKNG